MTTGFPTSLDSFTNPSGTDNLGSSTVPHAEQHANLNDAMEAVQAKVGIDGSADADSLDNKIATIQALGVGDTGFVDYLATVVGAPSGVVAPTLTNFGPAHTPQRQEMAFAVNDYVFIGPHHINHDVKPNGLGYMHIHWSTSGTNVNTVKWELTIMRAKGHNQENFAAPVVKTLTCTPHGTAWRHMINEVSISDALTFTEPDELIMLTLRRVTNGGTDNSDSVFALMCDMHVETDRLSTPGKAPPFY